MYLCCIHNIQMIRDVKQIEESTLWEDTGRQIANKNKQLPEANLKKVCFIVGQKSSGKSSFLKIVRNDFDPETKPNSLVEYIPSKIGRQKKQLIHFYEIGSVNLLPMISTFASKKGIDLSVIICVDLSKGKTLIASTTQLLNKLMNLSKKKITLQAKQNHQDNEFIIDMPFRVGLVGCKWDLFEKLDLQTRKWTSRSLRYLAHTHSASALTTSNKNSTLSLNLRSAFSQFFMGQAASASKNAKDLNKPIFVKFGDDRIGDMNLPTSGSMTNIQVLEKQLESGNAKQPASKEHLQDDLQPVTDSRLDDIITAKRKELAKFLSQRFNVKQSSKESYDLI